MEGGSPRRQRMLRTPRGWAPIMSEGPAGAQAVGWVHLGADDEAAGGELIAQGGRLGDDVRGRGGAVWAFAHDIVSLADGRRGWQPPGQALAAAAAFGTLEQKGAVWIDHVAAAPGGGRATP